MTALLLAVAMAAALHVAGWWLVALVGFGWGVVLRSARWPALRVGAFVTAIAALRLGWLAWRGAPVADAGSLVAAVAELPVAAVWAMALLLPALVAACAATIGSVVGRRVLFG